jgi:hypothetical protein
MKTSENGGLLRLLTSFPKSAFLEYMSYETQQMYSRYLPSFLTLLSSGTSFIPVLVTHFILFDISVHVFALSFYSHLNNEI